MLIDEGKIDGYLTSDGKIISNKKIKDTIQKSINEDSPT
jgi:hypothetical protein